jgi:hypothetical protein
LLVLIVIVGPTFAAFIFLLALIFTSRQVALLPLTFFSLLVCQEKINVSEERKKKTISRNEANQTENSFSNFKNQF